MAYVKALALSNVCYGLCIRLCISIFCRYSMATPTKLQRLLNPSRLCGRARDDAEIHVDTTAPTVGVSRESSFLISVFAFLPEAMIVSWSCRCTSGARDPRPSSLRWLSFITSRSIGCHPNSDLAIVRYRVSVCLSGFTN